MEATTDVTRPRSNTINPADREWRDDHNTTPGTGQARPGPSRPLGRAERSDNEDVQLSVSSGSISGMTEITVSDARARLADVVDAARVGHDPVYLTRRGKRVAAVIDADDLDRLIASAEDLADIEAAKAARAEIADGEATIPWEQVKADLGLA